MCSGLSGVLEELEEVTRASIAGLQREGFIVDPKAGGI